LRGSHLACLNQRLDDRQLAVRRSLLHVRILT
jgi:hypothetical protein